LSSTRAVGLIVAAVAAVGSFLGESVRAQEPSTTRAALVQALEYVRADDCKSAEPLLKQVIAAQTWNVAARRLLGRCLLDAGRWDEARPQFEALLQLAPEDAAALAGLRAAVAAGQKIESARQVEQIESRRTRAEQLRAQYEMRDAEQMIADGRQGDAERALLAIMAKRPEEIAAAVRLAELYSSSRRFTESAQLFEKLAGGPDASSSHLVRAAQNYEWGGDDASAAALYAQYLEREKGDRVARLSRGRALMRLGRFAEAVTELVTVAGATGAHAGTAAVALDLARCYDRLKRNDLALATYESVTHLDPKNQEALRIVSQHRYETEQAPLRRGFAALDAKDNETAAKEMSTYLDTHPENAEIRLQLARVYSWSSKLEPATASYREYLAARPKDETARRELAQVLAWRGLVAESVREYQTLAANSSKPDQTIEDLGSVLTLQVQAGDLENARGTASRLLELQPGHEAATAVLAQAAQRRRAAAMEAAQTLTAAGRYAEAIEAYRKFQNEYGADPALGLLVSRLHSWGKDYAGAIDGYREYLKTRPEDDVARAELAAVLTWSNRTAEAQEEYLAILARNPGQANATLRLAQLSDQRGEDPIRVLRNYEGVLARDPKSAEARKRARELKAEVAPRPYLLAERFEDSDDLVRVSSVAEVGFVRAGRLTISPIASYLSSEQRRVVGGTGPAVDSLNEEIARRRGRVEGGGLGLRLSAAPGLVRLVGEASVLRFDTRRTSVNGRADFFLEHPDRFGIGLQYLRREGVFDLGSGAASVAGIVGDTALASAWRAFGRARTQGGPPFRVWVAAGASFYSESSSGTFAANRQDRVSGRVIWDAKRWASVAYTFRYSSFEKRSPLYYSPARDTVHGVSASLASQGARLRGAIVLEGGREAIEDKKVTPFLIQPSLEWFVTPRFPVKFTYRYARSAARTAGSSTYIAQTLQVTFGNPR
jgi:tetratricopeptide (TPR) repeat protein